MDLGNTSDLTIARLAPLLRKRKLSPVELTKFLLERIDRLQPFLNAFITVTADRALSQARSAERAIARGQYLGVMHGIPICLKDLFYTAGIRTTAGSRILKTFVPKSNAAAVNRLFAGGSILLGKTNLHEFAYGVTNVNPHYGPVRNPWDLQRMSGGSSGGSAAAVTAALALASLGTDTGGSIRIPAAACGCAGFKPTYGAVSLEGVIPLAPSMDHVGPLCRCVEDIAAVMSELTGKNYAQRLRLGAGNLRIGIPRQFFFSRIQSEVRSSVETAIGKLEELGAEIHEVKLQGMNETAHLAAQITAAEALAVHWKWLSRRAADYGPDLRRRLAQGRNLSALVYLQAQKDRDCYAERWRQSCEGIDVLAVPALPVVAPHLHEKQNRGRGYCEDVRSALLRLTRPGNLTGLPAISVPCGFSAQGLPIGLQLIGSRHDDATLLRIAFAYEQATPWHTRWPADNIAARSS